MNKFISSYQYNHLWFILTLTLFVVQFVQPEESIRALTAIKPHLIFVGIVGIFLFFSKHNMLQWQYPQMKIFWLFLAYIIALIPFSLWPDLGTRAVTYMFAYAVFMASLIITVDNENRLKVFVNVLIISAVFIATRGILTRQYVGDVFFIGNGNYFTDPNEFSLYMNMMIPFSYFAMLRERTILLKLFYLFATLLFVAGVVISFSRGGFIALAVVSAILVYFSPYKKQTIPLLAVLALFVFFVSPAEWKGEMATSTDTSESTATKRLDLWTASFDVFLDNPFGVGAKSSPPHIYQYVDDNMPHESHSIWFTTLAETGIIGITLLIALLIWSLKQLYGIIRSADYDSYVKWFAISCFSSFVGYLVSASLLSVIYSPYVWYLATFAIVATKVYNSPRQRFSS